MYGIKPEDHSHCLRLTLCRLSKRLTLLKLIPKLFGQLPFRRARHEGVNDGLLALGCQAVGNQVALGFRVFSSSFGQALLDLTRVTEPSFPQVAA